MKVNIIFQNIQLLACFFFWTSSTSNLYLAIQSSCRKRKREVKTVTSTNQRSPREPAGPARRLGPVLEKQPRVSVLCTEPA